MCNLFVCNFLLRVIYVSNRFPARARFFFFLLFFLFNQSLEQTKKTRSRESDHRWSYIFPFNNYTRETQERRSRSLISLFYFSSLQKTEIKPKTIHLLSHTCNYINTKRCFRILCNLYNTPLEAPINAHMNANSTKWKYRSRAYIEEFSFSFSCWLYDLTSVSAYLTRRHWCIGDFSYGRSGASIVLIISIVFNLTFLSRHERN